MTTPSVVVCGGAGYIGSHMVRMLVDGGYRVTVVDNLATGFADAVHAGATLRVGDIGDPAFMRHVLREHTPQCVMHFAAASLVGQSIVEPAMYWQNNVVKTLTLLDAMRECGVGQLIFSSTAAVYGDPLSSPMTETHRTAPVNPYGHSKLAVETALKDYGQAYGLRYVALRYFNAAGAHPDGTIGERHEPETHLIPLVLQVASGRRPSIGRFGIDFSTRDGSCVRDYIHVQDLCDAHLRALNRLADGGASATYNLGNGTGHTVTEVIEAVRRVTGRTIIVRDEPRRAGDPPELVADASMARRELAWRAHYPDIDCIVRDAWQWELARTATQSVNEGTGQAG